MRRRQKIHRYRGAATNGSQCGPEIFDPPDSVPVMVLTQLPWNMNTSVPMRIENLAAEVALEYLPEHERSRTPFRCIQHLYSWLGGEELFEQVTSRWVWPREDKNWDRPSLGQQRWQRLSHQELEALIGEPYVECFHRAHQIASRTGATIEAVRLLRTHFSRLARCHGPQAAALGRKDLPVIDSSEAAGQLYGTSLAQWLFFPDPGGSAKLLSDEIVASRWDVQELTRQLLLSVRQNAEIFLTRLELRQDHAGFAGALVDYFASSGRFLG